MATHGHNLGYNGLAGPLDSKDLSKLLEIVGCRLADRENGVAQPSHAKLTEFLVEELHAKLAGEKRDVVNNSQPNTPLLVLCQLNDGGKETLREKVDANNLIDKLQF